MATLMSQHQQELDPVFVKALKLLQSRREDSARQLRAMLDEAILQRRGGKALEKPTLKTDSKSTEKHELEKKEGEKKNFEKVKRDTMESEPVSKKPKMSSTFTSAPAKKRTDSPNSGSLVSKRSGLDSPSSSSSPSLILDRDGDEESQVGKSKIQDEDSMDVDDFVSGMGISCVHCGTFEVTSKNQLVECQECHNLYHQDCHKPPITEDVNDPRFVWYCSSCAKNLKKMVSAKSQKPKPAPILVTKESSVRPKDIPSTMMAFKRIMDPLKPAAKESSQGPKGWAGLVQLAGGKSDPKNNRPDSKSLQGKSQSSKSSTSSSKLSIANSSSRSSGSGTDSSSSDKKLLLKKKSSSKSHDKKK